MSVPQKILPNNRYLPANLHENKSGWIIEYFAFHPQKQVLQRKQIRLKRIQQRYTRKIDAKRHALEICETINQKLRGGWSPFFEGENARLYEKLPDVLQKYITETRTEITKYLIECENYGFALVLNLVYSSLIRPNEIRNIQIKHVNITDKYVTIPCEVAKNHHERHAALSEKTIELLKILDFAKFPKDYYLLGGDLVPAKEMCGAARYRHEWNRVTKKLQIPKKMQLYSFRDTGIYEMLKSGIDDLSVMQHADHSSLDITTRYANHADSKLIEKINKFVPDF
ncbi:MAG: tyrosine-type recombinase/integrase [Prevotellaceae bacterium]|jgi:integrase|nr:tyrosine-type recombinase/integrase [Prevotellaceae bacterium]